MAFGPHFGDFASLLGSLLETSFVTFWGTIFASIFRPPQKSKKEGNPLPSPGAIVHAPPLLGLLPLVKPLRGAPVQTPHAQAEPELSGTADICPVSTEDIYPVSTEDGRAAGHWPAAVTSSIETG